MVRRAWPLGPSFLHVTAELTRDGVATELFADGEPVGRLAPWGFGPECRHREPRRGLQIEYIASVNRLPTHAAIFVAGLALGCEPLRVNLPGGSETGVGGAAHDPLIVNAVAVDWGARTCPRPQERSRLGPYVRREAGGAKSSRAYFWSGGVVAGDLNGDHSSM